MRLRLFLITRCSLLIIGALGIINVNSQTNGYGDQLNGYPNWQEQSILVLTNACRLAPIEFRDKFIGTTYPILEAYPSVPPIYWSGALNTIARFHANELATVNNCPFSHNSCDGTSFSQRVWSAYTPGTLIGENIAAGYKDPLQTINQWIRDDVKGIPAPDNSSNDGHRKNIMNAKFKELGCGYIAGTNQYTHYWVQDFGGLASPFSSPVPSGAHFFIKKNLTTFMANYYNAQNQSPKSALLILEGLNYPLKLDLGKTGQGTYAADISSASACRNYYFSFEDSSGTVTRFPENGYLITKGEGNCTEEYTAQITTLVSPLYNKYNNHSLSSTSVTILNTAPSLSVEINVPTPENLQLTLYKNNGDYLGILTQTKSYNKAYKYAWPNKLSRGLYVLKIEGVDLVDAKKVLIVQ